MVRIEVGLEFNAAHLNVGFHVREAVFPKERNVFKDVERHAKSGLDPERGISITSAEAEWLPVELPLDFPLGFRDEEAWTGAEVGLQPTVREIITLEQREADEDI